jgi:dihydroorotase
MAVLIKGASVYKDGRFSLSDISISPEASNVGKFDNSQAFDSVFDFDNSIFVIPSFVDVHVHLREPGFFYKETIKTGTLAAAKGGYTVICSMPNLNPPPDSKKNLDEQLNIIKRDAVVKVIPYGTITAGQKGEGVLSDFKEMADYVIAFSDDGRGVQSESLMRGAMEEAAKINKIIAAHCEDNTLLNGGYIHDGVYAKKYGHAGICSESEWGQIKRDLALAKETGCRYHVCHVSTKESVALIRQAKKEGVRVSCETAPHYLVLCDEDLKDEGRFKMNPPLRSKEDREALREGLCDGTIDVIATDHAPHSAEEKSKGLKGSAMGIVGLECSFPVLYTNLVKKGVISFERLVELMSIAPRRIFNIQTTSDYTVLDTSAKYKINSEEFLSKGRATPFDGADVFGKVKMTIMDGKIIYNS